METKQAIEDRHSVRVFTNKDVEVNKLKGLVKLAQKAPSWVDSQPWKIYLVRGKSLAKLKELHLKNSKTDRSAAPEWPTMHRVNWDEFPRDNMAKLNLHRTNYLTKDELDSGWAEAQQNLYYAPAVFYLTIPQNSSNWLIYDLGAFAQTLMLAATDMGLGSMVAYEFVKYPDEIRQILPIPEKEAIAVGIAVGYEAEDHINNFRSERLSLDNVLQIFD